jgi:hypothetical protein
MVNFKSLVYTFLCGFLVVAPIAEAQTSRQALVLLPVQGLDLSEIDKDNYRIALQQSLSRVYEVYSGGEVEKRLEKSSAVTCDVNECLQEVAISFQGELIARLVVTSMVGGYILALEIKNIFDDQLIMSQNIPCEGCNNFDVMRELQSLDLGGSSTIVRKPVEKTPEYIQAPVKVAKKKDDDDDDGTSWWVYGLGILAVGAIAASATEDDPTTTTADEGEVTISW